MKLKIHLVQRYYNLSDRQTEEKIIGNIFIKRFIGLPVAHLGFDHSTIALDRDRMGSELFHACFHHILEQARAKGLWGAKDDLWLIDSFHTQANVAVPHAYGLVQQGMLRLLRHLKRKHRPGYERLKETMDLRGMLRRLPRHAKKADRLVAFSRLMALAHGLLAWFENAPPEWENPDDAAQSLELQTLLRRILAENVKKKQGPQRRLHPPKPPTAGASR